MTVGGVLSGKKEFPASPTPTQRFSRDVFYGKNPRNYLINHRNSIMQISFDHDKARASS